MKNNNQTNNLIRWFVIVSDFLVLNALLGLFTLYHPAFDGWGFTRTEIYWFGCNVGLMLAELKFSTIIHERMISAGDILHRLLLLSMSATVLSYFVVKIINLYRPTGWLTVTIGICFFLVLLVVRLLERMAVKRFRRVGRNTRMATFVGSDCELMTLYDQMIQNPTVGYKLLGYYADEELDTGDAQVQIQRLGTLSDLLAHIDNDDDENFDIGDELYVCLSRREGDVVRRLSYYCDQHVKRFYYLPVSVESLGINLKREFRNELEIYTTYENLLDNPVNQLLKRCFDIVFSLLALLLTLPLLPIVALIIKLQSPGPLFFKQERTGIDGKTFNCYKFRSMHVNADADKVQATEDDPRKYPFGNFMRKANIDELPQFWNVLKGDMSIVGPRPHMLLHTEMYSQLISKYMVRHFVKPGVTGWAQVTGFRGETKELWQMEGRVKRDIWYIEHWSVWLDLRIIWMTVKSIFVHDENAY